MLGSVSEAEEAVQENWLRYEATPTRSTSTRAFLPAVVTRIAIDVLRSAASGGRRTSDRGSRSRC
jgi:RNA polymerase sigma-70 factor (ECF subfamily)